MLNVRNLFRRIISGQEKWKQEFNSEDRALMYDLTINLFALRRAERLKVLETLLPGTYDPDIRILELGAGTGILTGLLLDRFTGASITAVDGAEKMLDQAKSKSRLQENRHRLEWVIADYSSASWLKNVSGPFHLVVTMDALHHLTHVRKRELYREINVSMEQGGLLLMSDHMTSREPFYDDPQYMLWIQEIFDRLKSVRRGSEEALTFEKCFSCTYDDLQKISISKLRKSFTAGLKQEGENPMTLEKHIDALRGAGFDDISVEYRYSSFAVIAAQKR